MLHCSVLRTLMRRIEARTLRSSHVCTCLSLSGIDLSTAALSRADGTIVLSESTRMSTGSLLLRDRRERVGHPAPLADHFSARRSEAAR